MVAQGVKAREPWVWSWLERYLSRRGPQAPIVCCGLSHRACYPLSGQSAPFILPSCPSTAMCVDEVGLILLPCLLLGIFALFGALDYAQVLIVVRKGSQERAIAACLSIPMAMQIREVARLWCTVVCRSHYESNYALKLCTLKNEGTVAYQMNHPCLERPTYVSFIDSALCSRGSRAASRMVSEQRKTTSTYLSIQALYQTNSMDLH